jgi:hypothetical protein
MYPIASFLTSDLGWQLIFSLLFSSRKKKDKLKFLEIFFLCRFIFHFILYFLFLHRISFIFISWMVYISLPKNLLYCEGWRSFLYLMSSMPMMIRSNINFQIRLLKRKYSLFSTPMASVKELNKDVSRNCNIKTQCRT